MMAFLMPVRAVALAAFAAAAGACTGRAVQVPGSPPDLGPTPIPTTTPPSPRLPTQVYPTRAGGREWSLPVDAENATSEWRPDVPVTRVSPGVFFTAGSTTASILGEVRMTVRSPAGRAWWRNVEITGYFRQTGTVETPGQSSHWELLVRGERHSSSNVRFSAVNDGVAAPPGTVTWPWYPLAGTATVTSPCLGTSYHANVYDTGRVHFEKEITHTDGYATSARADATHADLTPAILGPTLDRTFGMKFVVRDADAGARVHLELWLDPDAAGTFTKVAEVDDSAANPWSARTATMNGCTAAPYGYTTSQLLTFAGPWVTFRSDGLAFQFSGLSVREIDPL